MGKAIKVEYRFSQSLTLWFVFIYAFIIQTAPKSIFQYSSILISSKDKGERKKEEKENKYSTLY